MRSPLLFALSLFTLATLVLAGNPVVLTDANFDHDTQLGAGRSDRGWFIKFYAPWCGHCKHLAPKWESLVDELKNDPIAVGEVDATVHRELASRFGISGYPTLYFMKGDKMYRFKGRREVADMAAFARSGYTSVEGVPLPPSPHTVGYVNKLKRHVVAAMNDIEKIMSTQRIAGFVIMSVGMSFGITIGFAAGSFAISRTCRSAKQSSSKKVN